MAESQFDVFLCHNSEDKPAVIEIAQQLQKNNLKPWLDAWELRPGAVWQFVLDQQIESIGAAAVFVGQQGLGPWQEQEIYAFLQEFIRRGCPVIPVMLSNAPQQPRLPVFLRNRHWVDFRLQNPDPMVQLIWGITGVKPENEQLKTTQTITSTKIKSDIEVSAPSPPQVARKELHECDHTRILYLKNIKDPAGGWSYTLNHIQQIGGSPENRVFEMYWLLTSKGAKSAKKGDLMILNQHARVTHVVEMLDDEVRQNEAGYFRWVRIVWLAREPDWYQLPHQKDVLGFSPPRFGGGTAYSFASPNFKKFRRAWEQLSNFQLHIVNCLQALNAPKSE